MALNADQELLGRMHAAYMSILMHTKQPSVVKQINIRWTSDEFSHKISKMFMLPAGAFLLTQVDRDQCPGEDKLLALSTATGAVQRWYCLGHMPNNPTPHRVSSDNRYVILNDTYFGVQIAPSHISSFQYLVQQPVYFAALKRHLERVVCTLVPSQRSRRARSWTMPQLHVAMRSVCDYPRRVLTDGAQGALDQFWDDLARTNSIRIPKFTENG